MELAAEMREERASERGSALLGRILKKKEKRGESSENAGSEDDETLGAGEKRVNTSSITRRGESASGQSRVVPDRTFKEREKWGVG